jgi:hypothetical protein
MTRVPKKEKRGLRNPFRQFDAFGVPRGGSRSLLGVPVFSGLPSGVSSSISRIRSFSRSHSQNVDKKANFETPVAPSQALVRLPFTRASRIPRPTFQTPTRPIIARLRNLDVEAKLTIQRKQLLTLQRPPPVVPSNPSDLLAGTCNILSSLFAKCPSSHTVTRVAEFEFTPSPVTVATNIMRLQRGNTTEWCKVFASATTKGRMAKTAGFIQYAGSNKVPIMSISGYSRAPQATKSSRKTQKTGMVGDNNNLEDTEVGVLDGLLWTEAVLNFCEKIGHKLPSHLRDKKYIGKDQTTRPGIYHACHSEKKLILYFLCHYLTDGGKTDFLDQKKFEDLRDGKAKLEGVLTIDKSPCDDCLELINKIQRFLKGVKISIQTGRKGEILPDKPRKYNTRSRLHQEIAQMESVDIGMVEMRTTKARAGKANGKSPETPRNRKQDTNYPTPATTPRRRYLSPSPSSSPTPTRRTRKSGLLTPSELVFSFDALDILDRRRGRRKEKQVGKQMGVQSYSIPTDTPSPRAESSPSPITRRTIRMSGVLTLSPSVFEVSFDALDRLDRRRGKRGARSGKRTYVD